jgi:hypothetical protein
MPDFDATVAALRKWTKGHDPHVRAAVELLIADARWLRRQDFTSECVQRDPDGTAWISWAHARDFIGTARSRASTTEMAVLEIAVAIGSNRYKLSYMNDEQAAMIVRAFADALAVEGVGRA